MNITSGIWRHSYSSPERTAVIHDGQAVSYLKLRRMTNLASARLWKIGVRRGDRVAVSSRNPLAYLVVVLASARLGASATAFKAEGAPAIKETLLARHRIAWLVYDKFEAWRSGNSAHVHIPVQDLLAPAPGEQVEIPPVATDVDHEPWLIATSSGTTGVPKSIAQTHARCAVNFFLGRPWTYAEPPTVLVYADLALSMGMGHVMRALLSGATAMITASASPQFFFEMVERDRPSRIVTTTGLATKLAKYAAERLAQSLTLCASVQSIAVSGASVSPALRESIRTRICSQLEVNYGSTEAGLLASATPQALAVHPESAGLILPWVHAEATDEQHRPLPPGTAGMLRFKTPALVDGYVGDDEATKRAFRDGWFYPGDTGSVSESGYLFLAGRADHLLNLGGRKLDPVVIENALNAHPAVLESAVVAVRPDSADVAVLVAVVVLQAAVEMDELRVWCSNRVGPALTPRQVITAQTLPKNAGGKLMREQLTRNLERKIKGSVEA